MRRQPRANHLQRKTLACSDTEAIRSFFAALGPFAAVVEATASYEWLWQLLEPLAQRLVLAHPSYFLGRHITAVKNKIRQVLAAYNADRRDRFSVQAQQHLAGVALSAADRLVVKQLLASWRHLEQQRLTLDRQLRAFAQKATAAEKEARAVVGSIPEVGAVTVDMVLRERGDVGRFRSAKKVARYGGLAPGQRESAGHSKVLGISKEGSALLRWALVEAAWRIVRKTGRWRTIFASLVKRRGRKKAIVAVARRLLGVMVALVRTGQRYRFAA